MLGEPMQTGASTSAFYVYVSDVDSMYKRATGAGAKSVSPPTDQFWGDRMATVSDPFGNTWSLATHKEDPTPEEMAEADGRSESLGGNYNARDPLSVGIPRVIIDCKFYRRNFLIPGAHSLCNTCKLH